MKSLVLWAGGSLETLRARQAEGARVVSWNAERDAQLQAAGIAFRPAVSYLEAEEPEHLDRVAINWTKAWGRRPLRDGRSFRELLDWRGVSLWWWAELYLHHCTRIPRWVRLIEIFNRILEAEAPGEVEALGLAPEESLLLERTCTAWRVLFHGHTRPQRVAPRIERLGVSLRAHADTFKTLMSALKAGLGRRPCGARENGSEAPSRVLFLSHAAFWRQRRDPDSGRLHAYEHYFDRIIPEVAAEPGLEPFVVTVGPETAFRRRGLRQRVGEWARLHPHSDHAVHVNRYTTWGVWRATWRATRLVRRAWAQLRHSPGLRESLSHSGVSFAELAPADLAATLLLQLPWAVRCFEETAEVLRRERPAALCLYAESSGWGRAALAAARAAQVPSVALQHGILYPTYFSYIHAPDEQACPRPDATAVFGEAAVRFLVERGGYDVNALVITGSPKFDHLLQAAGSLDRQALRARWGLGEGDRLLVLASRFRAIRSTHQAVGSAFPDLVRAVEASPGLHCVVKPHPAEPEQPYRQVLRQAGAARTRLCAPGTDLVELLCAADALVTVESLSAVEALVLDRPVVVLNMPSNLRELVESGAALGVRAGADPAPVLRALFEDGSVRAALAAARKRYLDAVAGGVDGAATRRIVKLIARVAGRNGVPGGPS